MKRKVFSYPYIVWMVLFILAPMLFVLYYAFTRDGHFSLEAVRAVLGKETYLISLWDSLKTAFATTAICLVLGYPVAYILSTMKKAVAALISVFFIVPMWMNVLLRTYAWQSILGDFIPALFHTGSLLNNDFAVMLGLVYNFLPFMILPIYSVIIKLDGSLLEAARDLGASSMTVFRRVILPLSLPGVISGITMVFVPSVSTFAISRMLGGGTELLLGDLIERQFLGGAYNPQLGAAISLVMMLVVVVCMLVMNRFGEGEEQAVML